MAAKKNRTRDKAGIRRDYVSPAPESPKVPSSYDMASAHEKEAEKHETVAQYHLTRKKSGLAAKHRTAAEKHMLAASYYRRASNAPGRYAENHYDRAEDLSEEADSYVQHHALHLDKHGEELYEDDDK